MSATVIDEFASRFVYFYTGYLFAPRIFELAGQLREHPEAALAGLSRRAIGELERGGIAGQRLEVLRSQREKRRDSLGQVRLEVDTGVASGKIVAELKDVTMRFVSDELLAGATLYCSLEPCCHFGRTPPCTDLILEKRIGRFYYF